MKQDALSKINELPKRQKLLIVDDERGIVDMMAEYFAPRYQVYTACSGTEALQKVSACPDLILLDINMPDLDGLAVCRKNQVVHHLPDSVFDGANRVRGQARGLPRRGGRLYCEAV